MSRIDRNQKCNIINSLIILVSYDESLVNLSPFQNSKNLQLYCNLSFSFFLNKNRLGLDYNVPDVKR